MKSLPKITHAPKISCAQTEYTHEPAVSKINIERQTRTARNYASSPQSSLDRNHLAPISECPTADAIVILGNLSALFQHYENIANMNGALGRLVGRSVQV